MEIKSLDGNQRGHAGIGYDYKICKGCNKKIKNDDDQEKDKKEGICIGICKKCYCKMPYKYYSTCSLRKVYKKSNIDEIKDYYLYLTKSKYIGNDPHIPNLVIRDHKYIIEGEDYIYHWGIELKEAINRGFEFEIREVNGYEGSHIY